MVTAFRLIACAAAALCLATAAGCDCPESGSAGQCDIGGLAPDTKTKVTNLQLDKKYCGRLPLEICDSKGISCIKARASGEVYRYQAMLITDADGFKALQDNSSFDTSQCVSDPPTDWTKAVLVLASIDATAATAASASFEVLAAPDGTPHLSVKLGYDRESDCDCAAFAAIGVILESTSTPTVCMQVDPNC